MPQKQKHTRDLLIRNVPLEIFELLEREAKEHHRSKTQEAIVALTNGLTMQRSRLRKPIPFKWKTRMTSEFIDKAIHEGRE